MNIKEGQKKFGQIIQDEVKKNPVKARKLCALSCDISVLRTIALYKHLSPCRRYAGRAVSRALKSSFANPKNSAMVSIFIPTEMLAAAGITPISIEAMAGFTCGVMCEQAFLAQAREDGEPETLCSFHRGFHGAMSSGVVEPPKMLIYTNLACDGNMVGFPYVARKYNIPTFFIEVPGIRSEESVRYVAEQLKDMRKFIEENTGRPITDQALKQAMDYSRRTTKDYLETLNYVGDHALRSTMESELYAVFSGHIMMGTKEAAKISEKTLREIKKAPQSDAIRLLWMHMIPYLQPGLISLMDEQGRARVTACDLVYDSMLEVESDDPFYTMAYRMVYSVYNGDYKWRVERAIELAGQTKAEGIAMLSHWGCKATFGATELFAKEFEKAGYPMLVIAGDGGDSTNWNEGQVTTRLEAFIEMLEQRRELQEVGK